MEYKKEKEVLYLQKNPNVVQTLTTEFDKDPKMMTVDECEGCGPNGIYVRYCPLHGLHGSHVR